MVQGGNLPSVSGVLRNLVEHGWIPLRSVGILLGYKEVRGIYQRQRGRNAIPYILVGNVKRIYADDVIHTLENSGNDTSDIVLGMYRTIQRQAKRESNDAESVRTP